MKFKLLDTGAQPIVSDDENLVLCVNGEIYNHKQLRANLKQEHVFKTHSDCEVIMNMVCIILLSLSLDDWRDKIKEIIY